ncbi:MAG: CotH kinase family protein [Flavobacteriales bacterium]|nr:CotH kinase family protein [Flavobacteriales bacterium]
MPSKSVAQVYLNTEHSIGTRKKKLSSIQIVKDSNVVYQGFCGIELHGNSTRFASKQSYEFELRDSLGEEQTQVLLDFAPEEDFILLSNYFDRSFTRNALAFFLWEQLGHYAPKYHFVELFFNDEYKGLYMLVEKIKVDENRLALETPEHPDENSWLVKLDWDDSNLFVFSETIGGSRSFSLFYPKPSKVSSEQYALIKEDLSQMNISFENILSKDNTKASIDSLIDVESFVDFFILNELSRNPDSYTTSTHLYRKNAKIHMGPAWDYDLAFANTEHIPDRSASSGTTPNWMDALAFHHIKKVDYNKIDGWVFAEKGFFSSYRRMPIWWHLLSCDSRFKELCVKRLNYLTDRFSQDEFQRFIDDFSGDFEQYIDKDEEKWSEEDKMDLLHLRNKEKNSKEDRERVKTFYLARMEWMRENIMKLDCHNPIDQILNSKQDTVIKVNVASKSFQINFLPDTNLFDEYKYRIINEIGIVVDTGSTTEANLQIFHQKWEPGNYYIEIEATEYWGPNHPSYSYGPEWYYRMFKVVVKD